MIVTPEANPNICVWIATDDALLQTSLLFTLIEGAEAVGGVLSVTTVEETVVFVFSANACVDTKQRMHTKSTFRRASIHINNLW